eukprot:TRINITY_DN7749_c0_g1_i1.p2 TRINITY_DN7749_c0_g1~~TRINITY_DN7749_c0_g1_i1.p2  ORF type:complete len:403 (+),score=174.85 TRINITY_DN7749_c0_g1_i1:54-1262(+)
MLSPTELTLAVSPRHAASPSQAVSPASISRSISMSSNIGDLATSVDAFRSTFAPPSSAFFKSMSSELSGLLTDLASIPQGGMEPSPTMSPRKLSLSGLCRATNSVGSNMCELAYEIAPGAEGNPLRWCNHLYACKCPYNVSKEGQVLDECKFLHLDAFVQQSLPERDGAAVPNLMEKNMKGLMKEMNKLVNSKAQRVLEAWSVMSAWGCETHDPACRELDVSPYIDTVKALRALGWSIPEAAPSTAPVTRLEDAPYAKVVNAILMLIAHSLHFDLQGSPEVMFQTVAYVFRMRPAPQVLDVQNEHASHMDLGDVSDEVGLGLLLDAESLIEEDAFPPLLESLDDEGSSLDGPLSALSSPMAPKKRRSKKNKKQRAAQRLRVQQLNALTLAACINEVAAAPLQ